MLKARLQKVVEEPKRIPLLRTVKRLKTDGMIRAETDLEL